MGIKPTDAQLDKIFDKVAEVNADPMEVDAYMKRMQAGPTKEQRAAEEAAKRKAEEEARKRKAEEEASKRKAEENARKLKEKKDREKAERKKAEETAKAKAEEDRKARLEEARLMDWAKKKVAESEKEKIEFATTRKKHLKRFFFWGIGMPLLVLIIGGFSHISLGSAICIMSLVGGLINFICSVIAVPNDSESKKMEKLNTLYCFLHVGLTCICIVALIVCVIMYFWDKLFS